jgi:hypothetical protein
MGGMSRWIVFETAEGDIAVDQAFDSREDADRALAELPDRSGLAVTSLPARLAAAVLELGWLDFARFDPR